MRYTVRPISDRTAFTGAKQPNPFRATWSATLKLLGSELDHLKATDVVLEVDVLDNAIRLDGMLKSGAKVATPGVRVAFESMHGPLVYSCDTYVGRWSNDPPDWQINIRAIALGLQALRAADRYGITRRGEQYAGFKALPAGRAMPASHMTRTEAAELLERIAVGDEGEKRERSVQMILDDPELAAQCHKHARAGAHPDRRGGDQQLWDQVEAAARVLGVLR